MKKKKIDTLKIEGDFNKVVKLAVSGNPKPKESDYKQIRKKGENKVMDKWEFYQDSQGKWRWRRIAPNGRIVGASTEGYSNRQDCIDNARRNGYSG